MKARLSFFHLVIIGLTNFLFSGCDKTKNIYKSSTSKKDYLTINAVTLTHCGCTHLYADRYKNGKLDFQVFYNDNLARKTMFDYSRDSKAPQTYSLLATTNESFTTPFDSVDLEIFRTIDSAIIKKQGFIYPIRRTQYKGYVVDTLLNPN